MTNKKNKITKGTPKAKPVVDILKTAQTQTAITASFEYHRHECPKTRKQYWLARMLMMLFGYTDWRRFEMAISRAMNSCEAAGNVMSDQFAASSKLIRHGSGSGGVALQVTSTVTYSGGIFHTTTTKNS